MSDIIHDLINRKNLFLLIIAAVLSAFALFLLILAGMRVILTVYPMPFFDVIVGCTIGGFIVGMVVGSSIVLIRTRWNAKANS